MRIIEIQPLGNGAHRNQTVSRKIEIPSGWAEIPDNIVIPASFPFVNITVEGNTVTAMTEGIKPTGNNITKAEALEKDLENLGAASSEYVKAVEEKANSKAPAYDYGTTDLTAGTSPLETGKLYFVYE